MMKEHEEGQIEVREEGEVVVEQEGEEQEMSLGDHLEELRKRLIWALWGVGLVSLVTFSYGRELVAWLCRPLAHAQRSAGLAAETVSMTVTSGFTTYMKVSMMAGLVGAAPWVVYQGWKFVSKGLYHSERKAVGLLTPFSTVMMVMGVLFAYYVLLPMALGFLIFFSSSYPAAGAEGPNFLDVAAKMASRMDLGMSDVGTGDQVVVTTQPGEGVGMNGSRVEVREDDPKELYEGRWWVNSSLGELRTVVGGKLRGVALTVPTQNRPLIELNSYIDFVVYMILATVVCFQLPVVMMVIGWTGLVSPKTIGRMRKGCVIVCLVASAVITPSGDPINMMMLAVPLYLLFEVGLVVMRMSYRKKEEDAEEAGARME